MLVFLFMIFIGLLLGFIGAGGSGFIISILTLVFGIPIQTAFGTSLAAMVFTTLSGAYSHFRDDNIVLKAGIVVGLVGAAGAFAGTRIADVLPVSDLKWLTSVALFLSAVLLGVRLFIIKPQHTPQNADNSDAKVPAREEHSRPVLLSGPQFWASSVLIGLVTGLLSGTFGIGSTPFIQIGLLTLIGLTLRQAVGTTMLVILPIALAGGTGYYSIGDLNFTLLAEVVLGTTLGAFFGAKLTKIASPLFLKVAMVTVPVIGSILLLL
ncbi:sulfite exporter TauE/SafE family protein [Alicyclobacillus sp. SO9]|uniref:sulfite exporter TauE/SafE family protein n=1 Tax=Alicyclobacillus sp. SO9 TaxID=2665646 RepID=UPI0018E83E3F|nr:sulfite exporter TauE/SafE family protein [Alicyclobacillus sp. SO9]QQE77702.1 sulfite exporter TauE/SafE family protein [Alicyclobacillus sp. SO9]